MSQDEKITVTVKAGPGYDAPWIVFHANTVAEAGQLVRDARTNGILQGVKALAAEFAAATPANAAEAVRNVQAAIPGSEVVSDQELSSDVNPFCAKCEQPAQWKEGVSPKSGPYSGWYCMNSTCENLWKKVK